MHQTVTYKHKNAKRKLHSFNADIYVNQECPRNDIIPNYANSKISETSLPAKRIQNTISILRLQDEMKFLCAKILSKICITYSLS